MFDEDDAPKSKKALFAPDAHQKCLYQSAGEYCPAPASCVTSHQTRVIEGLGRKSVTAGYCTAHYKSWHQDQDRKLSDQVLYEYLSNPESYRSLPFYERLYQTALKENPTVRMMAEYPPRTREEVADALESLSLMMRKATKRI